MITREILRNKLLAYLNGQMSLATLVDWAENTFVDAELGPDEDVDMLNDILAYLAAADTAQFPLTWEISSGFLKRLGVSVRVLAVPTT
ncbi:hypothetical protein KFU94_07830 [Chloroflexi bacterium TSY]|nr:hypothetical protein [Chloroflexi bacterium TSY]